MDYLIEWICDSQNTAASLECVRRMSVLSAESKNRKIHQRRSCRVSRLQDSLAAWAVSLQGIGRFLQCHIFKKAPYLNSSVRMIYIVDASALFATEQFTLSLECLEGPVCAIAGSPSTARWTGCTQSGITAHHNGWHYGTRHYSTCLI